VLAGTRAGLIALATMLLAGCQFANSPPSVAPNAGRSVGAAGTATATRPAASAAGPSVSPTRPASPNPGRSPTISGSGSPALAPTRTSTPRVPTLGRTDPPSPTPARGSATGAILPAGQERLTGDVVTFAASARVLQIRVDGGGERQVSLAPSAASRRPDGSPGTAADLRPGQRVQATGRASADAGLIADEVVLIGPR
jgi:hypothetical protein